MCRYLQLSLFCVGLLIAGCNGGGDDSTSGSSSPIITDSSVTTTAVAQTGQTICYDEDGVVIACAGTGQDGDTQKGAVLPTPRFTDNNDGTISDNLTGLMWVQNADCVGTGSLRVRCLDKDLNKDGEGEKNQLGYRSFINDDNEVEFFLDDNGQKIPIYEDCNTLDNSAADPMTATYEEELPGDGRVDYESALEMAVNMNHNIITCDVVPRYIDWRLPNVRELESLVDVSVTTAPAVPSSHLFTNVRSESYWTSTTYATEPVNGWYINFADGSVDTVMKENSIPDEANHRIWLVRNDAGL